MSYQTFTSIEELLEHVKNNVKELDGKFAVSESVDLFEQLDKKSSDHKKSITEKEALEKRARAAEAKLKEIEPKVAEYEAEIQHLKDATPPDEKVKDLTERLKKESGLLCRNKHRTKATCRFSHTRYPHTRYYNASSLGANVILR